MRFSPRSIVAAAMTRGELICNYRKSVPMKSMTGDGGSMRFLGLDVGDKTIGVAVSDELGITAQGLGTIKRSVLERDLDKLSGYVVDYDISAFVVGYPKNMNGTIGERALLSEKFAAVLMERFIDSKVILWDERLTTVAAQRMLIEAGVRRKGRKKVIDKVAAVLILQGYLDSIAIRHGDLL